MSQLLRRLVSVAQGVGLEASTSGRVLAASTASRRCLSGYSKIAEHEEGKTRFSGFYGGGFYVNNVQVPGSVMACSDVYMMWRPRTLAQITVESLVFLELLKPPPEVLVLGCGMTAGQLPREVSLYLQSAGIKVEVLDSRNATGYFNILSDEGRSVVGALLAMDPSAQMPEVMPEIKEQVQDRAPLFGNRGLI